MYDGVLCLLRSLVRLVVDVFAADLPNMVVCFAKLPKLLGSMSQLFDKFLKSDVLYMTLTIFNLLKQHSDSFTPCWIEVIHAHGDT